jgi:hypothetical protein
MNFNNQNLYTLLFSDVSELKKSVDSQLHYYGTTFLNKYLGLSKFRKKSPLFKELSKRTSLFYVVVNNTIGKIDQREGQAKSDMIEYGNEKYRSRHQKLGASIDRDLRGATGLGTEGFLKLILRRIWIDFMIMAAGDYVFASYLGLTTKWRTDVQKGKYSLKNGVVLPYHMNEVEGMISRIVKVYGPPPKPSEFIKLVEEERRQIANIDNFIEKLLRERPPIQAEAINALKELKEELAKGLEGRKERFIEEHRKDEAQVRSLQRLYEETSKTLAEREKELAGVKESATKGLKDLESRYEQNLIRMERINKMMIRDANIKSEGLLSKLKDEHKKIIEQTDKTVKRLEEKVEELSLKEISRGLEILDYKTMIVNLEKENKNLAIRVETLRTQLIRPTVPEIVPRVGLAEEERERYMKKIERLTREVVVLKTEAGPAVTQLAEAKDDLRIRKKTIIELGKENDVLKEELIEAYSKLRKSQQMQEKAEDKFKELRRASEQTTDVNLKTIVDQQETIAKLNLTIQKLTPTAPLITLAEQQEELGIPVQVEAHQELVQAIKDQAVYNIKATDVGDALAIIEKPPLPLLGINQNNIKAVIVRVLQLLQENFNYFDEVYLIDFIRYLSQIQMDETLRDKIVAERFKKNINTLKTKYSKDIKWKPEEKVVPIPAYFFSLKKTIDGIIGKQIDDKVKDVYMAGSLKGSYGLIEKIIYLSILLLPNGRLVTLGIETEDSKTFSKKLIHLVLHTLCYVYVSNTKSEGVRISPDGKLNTEIIKFYESIRKLTREIWRLEKGEFKMKSQIVSGIVVKVIEYKPKFEPNKLGIDFIIPSIQYFSKGGFIEEATMNNIETFDVKLSDSLYIDVEKYVNSVKVKLGKPPKAPPIVPPHVEKEVWGEEEEVVEPIEGEIFGHHVKQVKKMVYKKKFYVGCYTDHSESKLGIPKTGRFHMKFDYDKGHVLVKFSYKKMKKTYKFNAKDLSVTDGDVGKPYSFGLYDKSSDSSISYDFCVLSTHLLSIRSLSSIMRSLHQLGVNMDMASIFSIKKIVIKSREFDKFKFGWLTKMSNKNFIRLMDENYGVKKILEVYEVIEPTNELSLNIVGFTKILKTIKHPPVLRKKHTIQIIVHDNDKNRATLELIMGGHKLEKKIGKSVTTTTTTITENKSDDDEKSGSEDEFDFNEKDPKVIEAKVDEKKRVLLSENKEEEDSELLSIVQNICNDGKKTDEEISQSDSDSDVVKGIIDFL